MAYLSHTVAGQTAGMSTLLRTSHATSRHRSKVARCRSMVTRSRLQQFIGLMPPTEENSQINTIPGEYEGFPEMGVPPNHPSYLWISKEINHRAVEVPPCMETSGGSPPPQILLSSMTVSLIQTAFLQNLPGTHGATKVTERSNGCWAPEIQIPQVLFEDLLVSTKIPSFLALVTVVQVIFPIFPTTKHQTRKLEQPLNVFH